MMEKPVQPVIPFQPPMPPVPPIRITLTDEELEKIKIGVNNKMERT